MNKKKAGIIASACAVSAICASLIVGSTYALFTSNDKVDISVTAGKVNVSAKVVESSIELTSMGDVQEGNSWANGGTASFNSESVLELTNITPGDGATFKIEVTNNSNVKIQYRINWAVEGELAKALVVESSVAENGYWTEWNIPQSDEEKVKTVSVSVELPEGAGNEYQEAQASISFAVEAVQGNAEVYDVEVSTAEELTDALKKGGIVKLTENIEGDLSAALEVGNGTLNLNNHKLKLTTGASSALYVNGGYTFEILNGDLELSSASACLYNAGGNLKISDCNLTTGKYHGIANCGKLEISNSTINSNPVNVNYSAITILESENYKSELIADLTNVDILTNGCGVSIHDLAELNLDGCTIVSTKNSAIATNASNNNASVININSSKLIGNAAALLFNISGTLNVSDAELYAINQAAIIRSGNATFTNCILSNNVCAAETFGETKKFSNDINGATFDRFNGRYDENTLWGQGSNYMHFATIIVGNRNGNSYYSEASCQLVNTKLIDGFVGNETEGLLHDTLYATTNTVDAEVESSTTVTYDEATAVKSGLTENSIRCGGEAQVNKVN